MARPRNDQNCGFSCCGGTACLRRATGPRTCMLALPWRSHIEWRSLQKPLQLAIASDLVALHLAKGLLRDLWLLRFFGLDAQVHTTQPQ